jgi:hypothetical protein
MRGAIGRLVTLAGVVLAAAPATAQSTYFGAAAVVDVTRFSSVETPPSIFGVDDPNSPNGDALGFAVSAGRSIGERWGVALEVGRSGEIERRTTQRIGPILTDFLLPSPLPPSVPSLLPSFTDFEFELTTEQRHFTISALAWVEHDAGSRVELAYSAGITFLRSEFERSTNVTDPRLAIWVPVVPNVKTVEHTAGPTVGVEAAVRFTDHTAFTAGARMHGIYVTGQYGWLFRPSLGVRWTF